MGTVIAIGAILLGFAGFAFWMYARGRHAEQGIVARDEADRRREEDRIDAKPITPNEADDIARRLSGARRVQE